MNTTIIDGAVLAIAVFILIITIRIYFNRLSRESEDAYRAQKLLIQKEVGMIGAQSIRIMEAIESLELSCRETKPELDLTNKETKPKKGKS